MSRFSDYTAKVRAGQVTLFWGYELIDITDPANHVVRYSNIPSRLNGGGVREWAPRMDPLDFAPAGVSQRTATMRLPANYHDLVPNSPASPLHPDAGWKVYIYAGLVEAFADVNTVNFTMQASMLIDSTTVTDTSRGATEITVHLTDMQKPVRASFTSPYAWEAGRAVEDVMDEIVGQVMGRLGGPPAYAVNPTGFTVPKGSVDPGTPRVEVVSQLLAGAGHELVTTPIGLIENRPIPSGIVDGGEVWRYGQEDGLPIHEAERVWAARVPAGWRIEGGALTENAPPITHTVYDLDPGSESFYQGQAEVVIQTSRLPWVRSEAQALVAGYGQLRRAGVGPGVVKFRTIPNPSMLEGDGVELWRPEINAFGLWRVQGYRLPLHSEDLMEVTVRASWNPSQGLVGL